MVYGFLKFTGGDFLRRTTRQAKCLIMLLPFMALSCTSEDIVSDDSSVAVYSSLSGENQKIWDYFIKYQNCTSVVTTGIIRNETGVQPVGGYDDVKLRFAFTGEKFTIDGLGTFSPEVGKGIQLNELKLLPLMYFRRGICPAETEALFSDADVNDEMAPTRVKISYTGTGEFESAFIYFEGIPSKTNPKVTYTVDFEVF